MAVPKASPSLDLDFDEAVAYFRRHNAVTKEEWDKLDGAARRRAVRVASIAHRGVLNDVWKALEKNVAEGGDFRRFKAEIADTLRKKYGADGAVPAHLETIYLNETQRAFTHGRVVAALDPDVRQARPFWQFRAIEDNRITPICKECNGTIAEAGGAWWRSHLPPLHHRCRSSFVPLTPMEAERRGGVTGTPPKGNAQKGFGDMPDLDDDGARLEAAKSAQLPRELQPRLELAVPEGPPGHPERPSEPDRPHTPGDPLGEPVGDEIGEPVGHPTAPPSVKPAAPERLPRPRSREGPRKPGMTDPPWWTDDIKRGRVDVDFDRQQDVSAEEKRLAALLGQEGNRVEFLPLPDVDENGKQPRGADTLIGNLRVELKRLTVPRGETLYRSVNKSLSRGGQARNIVVDARGLDLSMEEIVFAIEKIKRTRPGKLDWLRVIVTVGDVDVTVDEF